MSNLILLIVCFLLGIILNRTGRFPSNSSNILNAFIINISLPALALYSIHELEFSAQLLFPVFMPWVVFICGAAIFYLLGRIFAFDERSTGCLMLTAGLGNTSFVGLPMIAAFYGMEYTGIGVLCDQPGSFLALSTLGIMVAAKYSAGRPSPMQIINKIALFPPFQAMVLALFLRPVEYHPWAVDVMKSLGATITPLALVSVGLQMRMSALKGNGLKLALGLSYKLVLAPLIVLGLFVFVLGGSGKVLQITIFEAAMGPMITAAIVAMDHDLNRPLATMMLGIGIPVSFVTLPLWAYLISWV